MSRQNKISVEGVFGKRAIRLVVWLIVGLFLIGIEVAVLQLLPSTSVSEVLPIGSFKRYLFALALCVPFLICLRLAALANIRESIDQQIAFSKIRAYILLLSLIIYSMFMVLITVRFN
jgi:hypothetical protein